MNLLKVSRGIDAGGNCVGVDFVTVGEDYAFGFAVFDDDFRDGGLGANFDSGFAGGVGDGIGDCSGAAAGESPGAECAVDFSHVVMQQNVGGSGRAHAEKRADDSRRRHGGLEHVGLEPLIEKIDGAHGHELDLVVFVVARHALKALADEEQLHQFARVEGVGVGRDHAQDRLHEAAHGLHGFAEFVVGFGVDAGVAGDLAMSFAVVVHAPEVVAAGHGGERAVERKDFEAVARKVEVADDFRPQQRHYVGADGELEAGKDFFGAGGAAENVAAFEHQNFLSGALQVGGVDQAVVASADHDYIV